MKFIARSSKGSFRAMNLATFIQPKRIFSIANFVGAMWYARRKPSGGENMAAGALRVLVDILVVKV
jgi:hypothetical protein